MVNAQFKKTTMKKSAGIILYRRKNIVPEIFLVHPGGPFWKNKDHGAWTIPKGEFTEEEDPLKAAMREFKEETGISIKGTFLELTPVKQKSGKLVYGWALEKDIDASTIKSNFFEIEWPPKSKQFKQFPEIDKGEWFTVAEAKQKINPAQVAFIDEVVSILNRKN